MSSVAFAITIACICRIFDYILRYLWKKTFSTIFDSKIYLKLKKNQIIFCIYVLKCSRSKCPWNVVFYKLTTSIIVENSKKKEKSNAETTLGRYYYNLTILRDMNTKYLRLHCFMLLGGGLKLWRRRRRININREFVHRAHRNRTQNKLLLALRTTQWWWLHSRVYVSVSTIFAIASIRY